MTSIGSTYAQALYTLASEEGLSKPIGDELTVLQQCFAAEPDFIRLLANPSLPKEERCQILDNSFRGKIQPYLLNFLKILTEKGYIRYFSDCCNAYRESFNLDHNILPVTATTAVTLSASQQKRLTDRLSAITGKTVELTNRIDSSVLGGVRLDYDGKRVDDTVAHRMDAVRSLLQDTVL